MEIQSFMASQYGVQDTTEVKRISSMTLNEFQANFHPNSTENIDTTVLDEVNKKISTMSYEEAKQYKPQIDEYLKQTGFTNDSPLSNLTFMDYSWIQTIDLTKDESFNKALFDGVKKLEGTDAELYMSNMIHNMEYSLGIKKYPAGVITLEEARGNTPFLSRNGAKQTDTANFFEKVLEGYRYWASLYDGIEEQTQRIIGQVKDLQEDYKKNLAQNQSILEQFMKNNKPNPFVSSYILVIFNISLGFPI